MKQLQTTITDNTMIWNLHTKYCTILYTLPLQTAVSLVFHHNFSQFICFTRRLSPISNMNSIEYHLYILLPSFFHFVSFLTRNFHHSIKSSFEYSPLFYSVVISYPMHYQRLDLLYLCSPLK